MRGFGNVLHLDSLTEGNPMFPVRLDTPEADGAIGRLQEAYDELVKATDAAAVHAATRYTVERAALSRLMAEENPATSKPWSMTAASENLDLVPAFAEWRLRRNELDLRVLEAQGAVEVARMLSRLHVSLVGMVSR